MYTEGKLQDTRFANEHVQNRQAAASGKITNGAGLGLNQAGLAGIQTKEIQARIDRLHHHLDALHQTANRLVDRLSPVLSPVRPQPETGQASAPDTTPIGSQLSELTSRVNMIGETLSFALDRLEI